SRHRLPCAPRPSHFRASDYPRRIRKGSMQGIVANVSMMRAAVLASAVVAVACTGNPSAGDASYKTGSLGNGGVVFAGNDRVACNAFSTGFTKDFPQDGVALGSTFNIYFVPKDDQDQPALSTPSD